ncbi:Nuclear transport factor 2 family protein [Nostoc sp. DSM 114161]|uniref:YybH family protein n=1 Tax=Nostoc sp. DSM 114161 TaxID=3440143 RepID=UPI00404602D6
MATKMTNETSNTRDEAQIRQLIDNQQSAICAKDVDRIMADYTTDVVYFDCKPPFQMKSADAFRRIWEECLPYLPDSFGTQTRDLKIFASGDLAFAHWLLRFTDMPEDHPAMQTWLRFTAGYQRQHGRWSIVHEHCSVPFDPYTSQAVLTLDL